jgi:hypothetical protein
LSPAGIEEAVIRYCACQAEAAWLRRLVVEAVCDELVCWPRDLRTGKFCKNMRKNRLFGQIHALFSEISEFIQSFVNALDSFLL